MESWYATIVLKSQSHHGLRERKFCAISPIHPVTVVNYTCLRNQNPMNQKISRSTLRWKTNTTHYFIWVIFYVCQSMLSWFNTWIGNQTRAICVILLAAYIWQCTEADRTTNTCSLSSGALHRDGAGESAPSLFCSEVMRSKQAWFREWVICWAGGNFCSAVEIGDEKLMLSITANGII